jgi:hypothetical protein
MGSSIVVYQDTKHLLNRCLEECSKNSPLYIQFSKEFHGCLTSKKITVLCRDMTTKKEIEGRLLTGEQIWTNMLQIVERYKEMDNKIVGPHKLFNTRFDGVLENQEYHVKNCMGDPLINGKHYIEMEDGHLVLLRGTNRNESYHRRINTFWPDKCGKDLSDALRTAHRFNWNFNRYYNGDDIEINGVDYSMIGICNVPFYKQLEVHGTSEVPFMDKGKIAFRTSDQVSSAKNYVATLKTSVGHIKVPIQKKLKLDQIEHCKKKRFMMT